MYVVRTFSVPNVAVCGVVVAHRYMTMYKVETVKPIEKKRMPDRLEFDHQRCKNDKRRKMEKGQKSKSKRSPEKNKVKPVRWNSMELLKPDFL